MSAEASPSRPEPAAPWNGLPSPHRWWAAAAIWLAIVMAVLDSTIANVALPAIAGDLHAAPSESIWVVNAYQLTILVSVLPLAALGESISYRRVFMGGLLLFTLASLGCALTRSLPMLALMRAVQGVGAAGIMSVNGALLRFSFPQKMLGRAIGLNAMVVSVAAVVGPSVASAILAVGPWPWLFAVNLPIGIGTLLLARIALPESPKSGRRVDFVSTALNVLTFGLIVIGVDLLTRSRAPLAGAALVAGGVLAGVLLVRRSIGQPRPLVPIDLLSGRTFRLTVLTSIGSFAAQALALIALPFYFEGALHRSQVATGLLMTPWPIAVGIAAPLAGRLADRYSAAVLAGIGLTAMAAGLVALAILPPGASVPDICWRMALCGLGFGFFQSPNNRAMLSAAPLERSGAAGGMLATARLTGQTAGATLTAIVFHLALHAQATALGIAAAFAGLAAVASVSRLIGAAAAKAETA